MMERKGQTVHHHCALCVECGYAFTQDLKADQITEDMFSDACEECVPRPAHPNAKPLETGDMDQYGRRYFFCNHCGGGTWLEKKYNQLGYCYSCAQTIGASVFEAHGGIECVPDQLQTPEIAKQVDDARARARKQRYIKAQIPEKLRWDIFERDGFKCVKCGDKKRLTVDHIQPERAGGTLEPSNLQTLCRKCNSKKGARV